MEGSKTKPRWTLGVVSYLNAKPLVAGLETQSDITLVFDVPSRLSHLLAHGSVDAALVPVIDLLRYGRKWRLVSDACIGCDGETLTVRVFSKGAPQKVTRLFVDGDSHSSVALAVIIWHELFDTELEILPFRGDHSAEASDAVLLIGDKVVTQRLFGFEVETDLGQVWKSLTGLPFVFAAWAARPETPGLEELARRLSEARDLGVRTAQLIAEDFAPGMGWPVYLAKRYLGSRLKFTMGPRYDAAIRRFHELAEKHGLLPATETSSAIPCPVRQ